MVSRTDTGDWVWSSDEEDDDESGGKTKTSKTPKVVSLIFL